MTEFFLLGKSLKSHGTGGQLRLLIEDRLKEYVIPDAFIFFDLDGSKVPFRIMEVDEGQHFVITLEDVAGKQASDHLSGKQLWIPLESVRSFHRKSPRHLEDKWEHFILVDESTNQSFPILRTEAYPQQLMAVILHQGNEILVPLHEQLITSIDKDSHTISMRIPDGLLEL